MEHRSIEFIILIMCFQNIFQRKMIYRDGILKRYLRPSRPRCERRWVEAWSSATTSTTARCGVGGISSSSSGQLQEPNVVPGVSYSLYGTGNPWCKLASRTRSCQDAHREALPSDPGLRHGRIPIFSRSKEEMKHWKKSLL